MCTVLSEAKLTSIFCVLLSDHQNANIFCFLWHKTPKSSRSSNWRGWTARLSKHLHFFSIDYSTNHFSNTKYFHNGSPTYLFYHLLLCNCCWLFILHFILMSSVFLLWTQADKSQTLHTLFSLDVIQPLKLWAGSCWYQLPTRFLVWRRTQKVKEQNKWTVSGWIRADT